MKNQKYFSRTDVVALLKSRQGTMSNAEYADKLGISRQFMSDVLLGHRGLSKKLLDSIGMQRVLCYEKKRRA